MVRAAYIFRGALEEFNKSEVGGYMRRWLKIPAYINLLRESAST